MEYLKNKEIIQKELNGKKPRFLSNKFKLWVVVILFLLVFLHLYTITAYPNTVIVPSELILGIVMVLIAYLWIQELRDRHRLELLNKALLEAQEQLKQAQIDTIATLILAEEAKDPYVRGHSHMVEKYCTLIGKKMNLPENKQKILERAAILHDIGKLGIVDSILNKPGKLDDEEWKIIKEHPRTALKILEPLKFLEKEKDIIVHHHEKYAGGGYPDDLKGDKIPLGARIMAVADTFDAMNSKRSYRKSLPRDVIISELKKVSGIQLDLRAVSAFLELLEEDPSLWVRDI
ncbi:MAG: HD domain-containing protein [Candidatus Omnitrophica bacterium]|nr:HD domain-containing protein [Candidatus Omnitrophota bacterium]MCF7895063.1 HD domain-containing protein [Candidatus Omnitrophota bacterium]